MILSNTLIFPVYKVQTQQVMTSQIRSHIEYLIQIFFFCLFYGHIVKIYEKFSLYDGF